MNTLAIRDELRNGTAADLARRRKIIALSSIGLLDFTLISLYQTGVIRKLPDVPLALFDSNKVNASKQAYMMGAPDGPISAAAYALSMVLASAGGSNQTNRPPVLDMMLSGVVAGNAIGGAWYLVDMITRQKKICLYCVTGAMINFTSAVIVAPLAKRAWKKLFLRKSTVE